MCVKCVLEVPNDTVALCSVTCSPIFKYFFMFTREITHGRVVMPVTDNVKSPLQYAPCHTRDVECLGIS